MIVGQIMTVNALSCSEPSVVGCRNGDLCPVRCVMTVFAKLCRRDMIGTFTSGNAAIMAAFTSRSSDFVVVHIASRYWRPSASWRFSVAGFALIGGRNMRPTATRGNIAIVATETARAYARVINRGTRPLVGGMTGVAFLIGRYGDVIVSRTCGSGAIVTT